MSHFEALKEDIRNRDQERPGIVLENGGVISGNRRFAALRTLYDEAHEQRFGVFEAFIIPEGDAITAADRWRLEMAAQVGQARLTKDYEPIERLLKIEEGVFLLMQQDNQMTEQAAVRTIANDFGSDDDSIYDDLVSLRHIKGYLFAIGHSEEWWHADRLTEVFLEFEPTLRATEDQGMSTPDINALKRQLFNIVKNERATHDLIRMVRRAIGTSRRNPPIPSATNMLISNAPSIVTLQLTPTITDKEAVSQLVDNFEGEVQARRDQQRPINLIERAITNMKALQDVISSGLPITARRNLPEKINEIDSIVQECKSSLNE